MRPHVLHKFCSQVLNTATTVLLPKHAQRVNAKTSNSQLTRASLSSSRGDVSASKRASSLDAAAARPRTNPDHPASHPSSMTPQKRVRVVCKRVCAVSSAPLGTITIVLALVVLAKCQSWIDLTAMVCTGTTQQARRE